MNNGKYFYKSFRVGGDPTRTAFLHENLQEDLSQLQNNGWEIEQINLVQIKGWNYKKQQNEETPQYCIIAKKLQIKEGEELTNLALQTRLASIPDVIDDIRKRSREAAEKGEDECIVFIPDEQHEDIAKWLLKEDIWLVNYPEGDQKYRICWGRAKEGYISEKT